MRSLVFALALTATAARPAVADDRKLAEVHVKQGVVYFKAEQYDDAIAEWKKAYELDKQSKTLFNIANAYYKKADYKSAVDFFQQYLAVDPDGPFAKQALEFSSDAKRKLVELDAKRAADEQKARETAEHERLANEAKQREIATTSHVAQAHAFEQATEWASAGDEYRGAAESSGDPAYLLQAAGAYRKQPALDKARDAYRAYLDKVPTGEQSDHVRSELANVTGELAKAERVAAAQRPDESTDLTSSLERAEREREQRKTAARLALRERPHYAIYVEPGYGGGGLAIAGTSVAPGGAAFNWQGPGVGVGAGVRRGVGTMIEVQARATASVYSNVSATDGEVFCTTTSSRCADTTNGSQSPLTYFGVEGTVRFRPSTWYIGLGPYIALRATHLQGTLETCSGSPCHGTTATSTAPFDSGSTDFVIWTTIEIGFVFGADDRVDVGAHLRLGPETTADGQQAPLAARLVFLSIGYAL